MPSAISSARAFWADPPDPGVIRAAPLDAPGNGEVLVQTIYSAISRGTESLVHLGRVPPSQYETMRAPFQDGAFPGPVKYGYANVGRVVSGPDAMARKTVFCLFPHQTAYVVPQAATIVVPDAVPAARAVLAANMETALNAVWDGALGQSDRVAVIGAGVIGCLIAYLTDRVCGAEVQLIDIDSARGDVAGALDLEFRVPEEAGRDFTRVFHASGSDDGLRTALSIAGFEAEIIEMSWFGDRAVALPLGEHFHSRRLTIRSSQVGHVARAYRDEWTRRDRLAHALSLLSDPVLDVLISGESSFDDLPDVMTGLITNPHGVLCHRIAYGPAASQCDTPSRQLR